MRGTYDMLAEEPVGKLFFKMVIPSVIAQMITLVYNIIDRIFIGHIPKVGSVALTGIGVCMPVTLIISAFAQLVGVGGTPRASMFMGKNRKDLAERTLGACTLGLVVASIFLTAAGQIFSRDILLLFGASEQTLPYALEYMRIYIWGTIFVELATGLTAFVTAQGFTNASMKIIAAGAALNIILDPVFIFGLGMGTKGAALATVISQAVSAVWVLIFLCGKKSLLKLRRAYIRPDRKLFLPCMLLGLSPCIMTLTECFVSVAFNRSLLRYGGDFAVGTMTIFATVMQIVTLPLQGFSQGAQPVTSYNYGAGNPDRVSENIKLLIKTSLCYACLLWLIIMTVPRILTGIFTSDISLIVYGERFIRIYFAVLGMMGLQYACQNSFLALGNARISIFLALLRKVFLLIPLIYMLPCLFADRTMAVFLAEPVADMLASVTTSALFFRTYREELFSGENKNWR